ncbi:gliding motility-associated C-terminal domain-containing protein [Aquimarina amphilecti]|uniref:Gliding motility-associated C-terminal domain-containing protein n=1 Tax=Aquimarina amphilecti TaxID=1038014 RepID=A0A1H7PQ51_AQUAM|nr:T9SS type B sorting domain-containing protein [Aquimarina amphilecti]SEL37706.1 gliding motility-associated C-terminal domain-containing protein [Aquimarina amphilecti]
MVKELHFTLLLFILCFNGYTQNEPTDCINSIIVCGNTNLELNSNGVGTNDFALPGNFPPDCAFAESQSLWIKVDIVQSGTLAFTITPESSNAGEDYDFAVYGPNVTCSTLGTSIRCSSTNPTAAGVSTLTGLNDTETETSEGPGGEGNGFVRSIDALAGEEYYILIDNFSQNGGFDLEFTGTAQLPDSPQNDSGTSTNLDLTECDIITDTNDGMTNFDLESNTSAILGSQINTIVTYHASEEDASLGNGALTSPYLSTQNNQTIYVRIENTVTECFVVDTFILITDPGPPIITPTPFIVCDTDDDGDDTNGFVSFLLNNKDSEILNGLNPTDYTLTYHISQSDADTGANIIDKTTPYTNISNPQTIFVRVQENASLLCLSTINFELRVNPLPIANASNLVQCDEYNDPTDGITLFNLNQAIDQITGSGTDRTITFFEDLTAANMGAPSIMNIDTYQNSSTNQQLFVRVTDDNNNCFRISTLDLQVSITSASNASLTICDDDGIEDGFREFDLTLANAQVLFNINNPNLSVAYYQNINDALSETNSVTSYTNITAGTQGIDIVYARVEDNLNQCYGINQVALFVNSLPDIEEQEDVILCQNENIIVDAGLQTGSNSNDFDYLWSTGETSETTNVTQDGVYEVIVTNQITGCSKNRIVNVALSGPAIIIDPIEINDASDTNAVTINVSGPGDYEYAIVYNNANIRTYQDSSTFIDVPPGFHTVYVRDKNGCQPETTQDISVVGFPKYFTPNGDGFHETWNIGGISSQVLGNSIIYIFDRSGKLLKQLVPSGNGWDGTYGGTLMPSSEYWYRVELSDGRIRKGSFSLIR